MSEKLEEILQRFKNDWDALEREFRRFIEELQRGDRNEFPDLDPNVQVPFVRLVLEESSKGRELSDTLRSNAIAMTLEMIERIRQEVRKIAGDPAMARVEFAFIGSFFNCPFAWWTTSLFMSWPI